MAARPNPINSTLGYYTAVAGLGSSPKDVVINGALHVDPETGPYGPSALDHFWRSLSNLTINPDQVGEAPHTMSWAVSQAAPLRRVNITGNLDLTGVGGSHRLRLRDRRQPDSRHREQRQRAGR